MSTRTKTVTCPACGRQVQASKPSSASPFVIQPHTWRGGRMRYDQACSASGKRVSK